MNLFRIIVPVTDVDHAARFYSAVLNFAGIRVSPGRHYFDCGGTILACFDPRADGDDQDATPLPDHLYFSVTDLEAVYQRAVDAGADMAPGEVHGDPAGEIATRPWGERSFYMVDPFGNQLCFVDESTKFTG